ncbi:hypothetical protein NA57DRAFT_57244 [Rhizodiscina lignyota]|uniref:Uncharacterized protein n=1 Tax=Rhizodiscina lignyota TaxID=1504668 RepID=A0A9P4IEX9_9PEZI|nr:hypothetical protein NA57DRAFT_57244 [Rhizodiscina lignyota]
MRSLLAASVVGLLYVGCTAVALPAAIELDTRAPNQTLVGKVSNSSAGVFKGAPDSFTKNVNLATNGNSTSLNANFKTIGTATNQTQFLLAQTNDGKQSPFGPTCYQTRKKDGGKTVKSSDLANFLSTAIISACQHFDGGRGGTISIPNEGYVFYGSSAITNDGNTCIEAFSNISSSCVVNGNSYGGQIIIEGQLYNLTNFVYPHTPLTNSTHGQFPPPGPDLPKPAKGCPDPFFEAKNFTLSTTAGQTTVSQDFDASSFPELFKKDTQWRVYTASQTDVKSWSLNFVGGTAPQVMTQSSPPVAYFELNGDDVPLLYVAYSRRNGMLRKAATASLDLFRLRFPTTADQPLTKSNRLATQTKASQFSLTDGTLWDAVNATGMLQTLRLAYPGIPSGAEPIDQFTSDFFHGPDNYDCGLVDSKCTAGLSCTDCDDPAGFAILESFAGLHNYFNVILGAINAAESDAALIQGTFTETFTFTVNTESFLKVLLDIGTSLLGMSNAGIGFFAGIGKLGAFEGKLIDKGASAVAALGSAGIAATKDLLPADEQMWLNENEISSGLQQFILGLKSAYSEFVGGMFRDGFYQTGDGQNFFLRDLVDGGLWLSNPFQTVSATTGISSTTDSVDVNAEFLKLFYAQMIQTAWKTSDKRRPAIMPLDSMDGVIFTDPSTGKAITSADFFAGQFINYKDKFYVLAGFDMDKGSIPNQGGTSQTLTGDRNTWGGLTIDDLIISSVEGWLQNGQKNGFTMAQPSFASANGQSNLPFVDGVRTPGFVNIPVCASNQWATDYGNPHGQHGSPNDPNFPLFPCNDPPPS